ncbi:Late endosome and vacuole interface protein [Quillaja saponaria]|uniref:Late endosome and vacuole interface protein n=1 Tax=Quillaja saponaria TaxID=32244 RepID=A0AAD7KMM7_QUISA|nr:Late endosome and vacuole interface protein [Quillaja saponaria]
MGVIGFCFDPNVIFLCGKRKLRSLFWRARAEIRRRQMRKDRSKQKKFNFSYDPLSYALNFDNGNFGFFC